MENVDVRLDREAAANMLQHSSIAYWILSALELEMCQRIRHAHK